MKTVQIREFIFEFRELTQEEYVQLAVTFAGYCEYFAEQSNEEKTAYLLAYALGLLNPSHDLTLDELVDVADDIFSNYPDILKMVDADLTLEKTLAEARDEKAN